MRQVRAPPHRPARWPVRVAPVAAAVATIATDSIAKVSGGK